MAHYLMQFFAYEHLREDLRPTSMLFAELAKIIDEQFPSNPEKTTCLRRLVEAKDCAVRALLFHQEADHRAVHGVLRE